ncbi:hypothetical protein niasHT_002711 [Heterodera trifolii]|uniref:Eukaryotic translation initiation factor 2 subunit 2 n=1 Tax=Heterodera trifolii TaxID=157864 RepID=A0ABD2LPY2_9BILA
MNTNQVVSVWAETVALGGHPSKCANPNSDQSCHQLGRLNEYVRCHTCRSSDTELTKDVSRLFFIQCKRCVSRFAVSSIKSGYTAMVGKRAALRRAAEATAGGGTQEFYYPF